MRPMDPTLETSPVSTTPTTAPSSPAPERSLLQWLGIAVAVAVIVVLCITAGRWQWSRYQNKDAVITTIDNNYSADPVPLNDIVSSPQQTLDDSAVWTPVTVTGHYVPEATALLRNRPINSTPSVHVLVPFETVDGNILLINRGWVPYDVDAVRPSSIPSPPPGDITVTVHLRQSEAPSTRDAPVGQVQAITVSDALDAGAAYGGLNDWPNSPAFANIYGALTDETPAPSEPINALPAPDTAPGSHLSYALQWWVFAIGAGAGFFVLIVKERRRKRREAHGEVHNPFAALNEDSHEKASASAHSSSRRKTRQVDNDYEDSLFE